MRVALGCTSPTHSRASDGSETRLRWSWHLVRVRVRIRVGVSVRVRVRVSVRVRVRIKVRISLGHVDHLGAWVYLGRTQRAQVDLVEPLDSTVGLCLVAQVRVERSDLLVII